uniref:Uncharacterized protein n=1 Tax=Panagrolaimus sp. PS1159 TaxID=55785 RepID=A0AC35FBF5_9BILA
MRLDEFYKVITYKMDVIGRAREESLTKIHKFLEGISPNDPALIEVAKTITETEKNLQDMMIVINNVVDLQLESYDSVNTMAAELSNKKQEVKNERPRVRFVDENEDNNQDDRVLDAENNANTRAAAGEDSIEAVISGSSALEKENPKNFILTSVCAPQMPPSPILSALANNTLQSSIKRPNTRFVMPTTPPTTQTAKNKYYAPNSTIDETPKRLNFDESIM